MVTKTFPDPQKAKYPAVESVPSTDSQPKKEERGILATYGAPSRIESGKEPQFNSKEFKEFAEQE